MRDDIDATRFPVAVAGPLCCKYLAVFFDCLCTSDCGGDVSLQGALWALAVHDSGERELLGVWLAPDTASFPWEQTVADLKLRGVESIRFIVGTGMAGMVDALLTKSFGAMTLPSIESTFAASLAQAAPRKREAVARALRPVANASSGGKAFAALRAAERSQAGVRYPPIMAQWRCVLTQSEPLFLMPAQRRRMVLSGDRLAQRLHADLDRSIGRQGSFASQEAVLDFVARALLRAERRFDNRQLVVAARLRSPCVGTVSGTAVQAFV